LVEQLRYSIQQLLLILLLLCLQNILSLFIS
jgi:hypothetical protein